MTQSLLFPIEIIDPAEVEPVDHRMARQNAYDAWNAAFLKRDYARRAPAIRASGDVVRLKLLAAYEATQREMAA